MPDPLLGTTIADYLVGRTIGAGGFASVYEARDRRGKAVAIKVLRTDRADPVDVARFAREIAIVEKLRHRNIATVHTSGVLADGRPYCVMELLDGVDLGTVVASGPLPPVEVSRIIADVAGALGAAHAERVVHRDVKASNVFRCADGRVVLLDFGIAKLAFDTIVLTKRGEVVGTVGAMSPEQLGGRMVDARSDIYALGALVHHLITGHVAFHDHAPELRTNLHRFAERPRASVLGAPPAIDPVIARAMALRPGDRHATVGELARAVSVALEGEARR